MVRGAAVSHDFVHMDVAFTEALEADPAPFVLKAVWDARRPRLVLNESITTGTLFDDFDKICAMLDDTDHCALLIRAGVASSNCWVAVTWVPAAVSSPSHSAPFDHFGESIMRLCPEFQVLELIAEARSRVTLEALSAKCMEVLDAQKEDKMNGQYTSMTAANIGNLDAWLAEQGYGAEDSVMDLSGVYTSSAEEGEVLLSQIGDAGEIAIASSVWAYTIDGYTITIDDSESVGIVTGSRGFYSISWSDGYTYTQQQGPSKVVEITPKIVGGRKLVALRAPDTCTAGLLLGQIALDTADRWEHLRLEYQGQTLQLDRRLVDLGISGAAPINVVRQG